MDREEEAGHMDRDMAPEVVMATTVAGSEEAGMVAEEVRTVLF